MKNTTITQSRQTHRPLISRLVACLLSVALGVFTVLAHAGVPLDRTIQIDVPPNTSMEDALIEWGEKANVTIMINTQTVARLVANEVHGTLTAREALKLLLHGSGLSYQDNGGRVKVAPAELLVRSKLDELGYSTLSPTESDYSSGPAALEDEQNDNESTKSERNGLSEVVVTAQKREERLQDVPVPVTAISSDALLQGNQVSIQDYYTEVPGLSLSTDFRGASVLTIRGLNGYAGNPTVGVLIDDVPLGSSTAAGFGGEVPDIDPSDLQQVEVLRGPQGTLYGSSSIGGLVKFVTVDPSTTKLFGTVQAGTSAVYNGTEAGYTLRGSINIPLGDTLAMRASGFARRDPGYINDVLTGQRGINRLDAEGGRVSLLWHPVDNFSLKVSGLYQYSGANGLSFTDSLIPGVGFLGPTTVPLQCANIGIGNLEQCAVRNGEILRSRIQVYSAIAKLNLGTSELTSISSLNIHERNDSDDASYFYGPAGISIFDTPNAGGGPLYNFSKTTKYTQEFRLSTAINSKVDSLVGLFYTREHSPSNQSVLSTDPITDQLYGSIYTGAAMNFLAESAAFADLTFHVVDRFDVQVGGRESHIAQEYHEVDSGSLLTYYGSPTSIAITPETDTIANAFTYLVTPSYKITPNVMTYARLASGYRVGGPNGDCVFTGVPCAFAPDKTNDYEIGVKGDVVDHLLSVDMSVYYIDWKNIQLPLQGTVFGYTGNAGDAKSQGIEALVTVTPIQGLRLSAWGSYDDAVLTQGFPTAATSAVYANIYGVPGNRIPGATRLNGYFSADEEFPVGSMTGFLGGQIAYVGNHATQFEAPGVPRTLVPGYGKLDMHVGLRSDPWTFNLYGNNLTDQRGILTAREDDPMPFRSSFIQPRTVGLLFSRTF